MKKNKIALVCCSLLFLCSSAFTQVNGFKKTTAFEQTSKLSASELYNIGYDYFLEKNWWFRYFLPVAFVMFYAATDEIHQTFVSGRSGNVIEVGIDTLGAVLIMTLISVVHLIIKRIKKGKVNKVLHSELF